MRPILQAYAGKDIPIEYAEKEAEAKGKHIEEWKNKARGLSKGGFTLSSMFGGASDVSSSLLPLSVPPTADFPCSVAVTLPHSFDVPRAKAP